MEIKKFSLISILSLLVISICLMAILTKSYTSASINAYQVETRKLEITNLKKYYSYYLPFNYSIISKNDLSSVLFANGDIISMNFLVNSLISKQKINNNKKFYNYYLDTDYNYDFQIDEIDQNKVFLNFKTDYLSFSVLTEKRNINSYLNQFILIAANTYFDKDKILKVFSHHHEEIAINETNEINNLSKKQKVSEIGSLDELVKP